MYSLSKQFFCDLYCVAIYTFRFCILYISVGGRRSGSQHVDIPEEAKIPNAAPKQNKKGIMNYNWILLLPKYMYMDLLLSLKMIFSKVRMVRYSVDMFPVCIYRYM